MVFCKAGGPFAHYKDSRTDVEAAEAKTRHNCISRGPATVLWIAQTKYPFGPKTSVLGPAVGRIVSDLTESMAASELCTRRQPPVRPKIS